MHSNYVRGLAAALAVPAVLLVGVSGGTRAGAAEQVLNLYTSRHYQTDEALYDGFTKATGIKINRIEGKEDALIERIKSEGANSPADVLITVDAGRLWRAEQAGLFRPVHSAVLEARIPASLRHPDGLWFGFSQRARLIFYDKARIKAGEIKTYEDLADPKWRGQICIRSSSNMYNLSLLGAMIASDGEAAAEAWAKGVVANFAHPPHGGDTDQIRAVAAGDCGIGVANSYYYARLLASDKDDERTAAQSLGVVFPNQDGRGTHINISGGGVLKAAPHPDAAVRFLEYLASDEAQRLFSDGNNEYPVVADVPANPILVGLGAFKADTLNVKHLGENQPLAQKIFDRVGWP
ncbi:MAG TPA: Fe(3+) ABC transporter substrate-binding protein [Kiloniellales bacterium]